MITKQCLFSFTVLLFVVANVDVLLHTVIKPLKEERIQIIREVEMLAQRESDELYAREHPH